MELKYNLGLDMAGFTKLIETSCEGYASLSLERLIVDLNDQTDLRCLDKRKEYDLQLRFGYRKLECFEDLKRVVRLFPGTASAAVIVTPAGGNPPLNALAAFRIAYSDAARVVGRSGKGSGHPLLNFGQEEFCSGIAIDPVIVSMWAVNAPIFGTNAPIASPPHAPEYIGLEPLLQYVQGGQCAVHIRWTLTETAVFMLRVFVCVFLYVGMISSLF